MLKWALLCLLVALATAFSQATLFDQSTQAVAKVLCYAALALFVVFVGMVGRSRRI
jgi:uncharacterized membrane protein YtjA (UPF0391 family)